MSAFPDPALQTWSDAVTVIDELFHLGGSKGHYDDYQLARAAHGIPEYASQMSLSPQSNVFHPKYSGMQVTDTTAATAAISITSQEHFVPLPSHNEGKYV